MYVLRLRLFWFCFFLSNRAIVRPTEPAIVCLNSLWVSSLVGFQKIPRTREDAHVNYRLYIHRTNYVKYTQRYSERESEIHPQGFT